MLLLTGLKMTLQTGAVPIEGTSQYANGYDVQVAKKIAKAMNKELLVVKTSWTGLIPALTSGKIDMIAAGMSPTKERRNEISFSNSYYTSQPVLVVTANGKYADATSLKDFFWSQSNCPARRLACQSLNSTKRC
ncbi:amino acid ABC transporter permease [Streptococcus pyogenes]|nr:amino acid ABC transporter permease [Streptococcus pyogenes]